MTQQDFLNRLNLTPEKVSRIQELAKSLEDFDKQLRKTAPESYGAFASGTARSANDSIDLISRVLPDLSRKEVEEHVTALLGSTLDESTSTSFSAIVHLMKK